MKFKELNTKHNLDLKLRDELVNNLKEQLIDTKRKAEQGLEQSLGEVFELEKLILSFGEQMALAP